MTNSIIVVTLSKAHQHYCQALLESIRYFHADLPIIIIKDGNFSTSWVNRISEVYVLSSKSFNDLHGLDLYILLNKLNLLWLPEMGFDYDHYIHIDADSILTGDLNSIPWGNKSDFYILQGNVINYEDKESRKYLTRFAFDPMDFPEFKFNLDRLYYFSASHIVVSRKLISMLKRDVIAYRNELEKELINKQRFKFNDQGFFNCMVNKYSAENDIKVSVFNKGIYGYQAKSEFPKLTLTSIQNKINTDTLFIHYTSSARKVLMSAHNYGDIINFFYKKFFEGNLLDYYRFEFIRLFTYLVKKINRRIGYEIKRIKSLFH